VTNRSSSCSATVSDLPGSESSYGAARHGCGARGLPFPDVVARHSPAITHGHSSRGMQRTSVSATRT